MLCRIAVGKLTWDESDGDTNDQIYGLEDQLVYSQPSSSSEKTARYAPF